MTTLKDYKIPKVLVVDAYTRYRERGDITSVGYGGSLAGQGFDIIVLLRPPKNDSETEWLNTVCLCRLRIGGKVIGGDDLEEFS